eukprot:jgi/Psemu1/216413/e_gw1.795.30.1
MCCICPPAIQAIFCLWVKSGFSQGTVAGALTFFPPDPPLYKFERLDKDGNPLPDEDNEGYSDTAGDNNNSNSNNNHNNEQTTEASSPSSGGRKTMTIIYSHGNATDIGAMYPLQVILSNSLECNVVSYDYSGYGESGGVAMEANTYADIAGVYEWTLKNVCGGDESRIVLYGQSVGSGPCCHLAKQVDGLGGMVLHSPFMSGMRVLTPSRALACLDIYPNIDRVAKAKCPVMVIHGQLDEEVDVSHGFSMHKAVPNHLKRDPWWVPDRGHNDITEGPGKLAEYVGRIRAFLASLD